MKNIIPFKKEVMFKTKISEVTSISLEHTLSIEKDLLKGTFIISGDYKVTDSSETTQNFEINLPFEIAVDEKYDTSKATIDIDDFYYEIINENILSISIDVLLDKLQEKLIINDFTDELIEEETFDSKDRKCEIEKEEKPKDDNINIDDKRDTKEVKTLFSEYLSEGESYKTYSVYIVRENDNIDSILEKYNITLESLKEYNDIDSLKLGDKLVIPYDNEAN